MNAFERYFWFISGAVALLNVFVWRGQLLRPLVASGKVSQAEANRFVKGAGLSIGLFAAALGAIQLVWQSSPRCLRVFDFMDPASAAASAVFLTAWGALLWWVWAGHGGEFLTRAGGVLSGWLGPDRSYSLGVVRFYVTGVVLLGCIGAYPGQW